MYIFGLAAAIERQCNGINVWTEGRNSFWAVQLSWVVVNEYNLLGRYKTKSFE